LHVVTTDATLSQLHADRQRHELLCSFLINAVFTVSALLSTVIGMIVIMSVHLSLTYDYAVFTKW